MKTGKVVSISWKVPPIGAALLLTCLSFCCFSCRQASVDNAPHEREDQGEPGPSSAAGEAILRVIKMTREGEAIGATDIKRGIARVKQAIEVRPNASSYLVLARMYRKNGERELAKHCYEEAIAMSKPAADEEARTWSDETKRRSNIPVFGPAYQGILREYEDFTRSVQETGQEASPKVKKP